MKNSNDITVQNLFHTDEIKYGRDAISNILGTADEISFRKDMAKIKALLWLYEFQTADEKVTRMTTESNGMGFNVRDAKLFTEFAIQIYKYHYLSDKQMDILRRNIKKYENQLVAIANSGEKNPAIDAAIRMWIITNENYYKAKGLAI